jgi:cobalt/nickel transport system permease protein
VAALIVGVSLLPPGAWPAFALVGLFLAAVVILGRLPLRAVALRGLVVVPFLLAALPLAFTHAGKTVWHVPLLPWRATDGGLEAFATVAARAMLSVGAAVVLSLSTSFPSLMRGLQGLRLSPLLLSILSFMHRYATVLEDEATRMKRAAASRSAAPLIRAPSWIWRARHAGDMVATLFIRALERSERVHGAMLARGYDGRPRFMGAARVRLGDFGALFVVGGVLLAAHLLR